jgi:hypothetical protein
VRDYGRNGDRFIYGNKGIVEYWKNGMMEKDVTSYKLWVNTLRLAPNDRNKD